MRNLKALFCLVISNHLTLIANTSSLFYLLYHKFWLSPTDIHLPPAHWLSPCTCLEDGRRLSEEVKIRVKIIGSQNWHPIIFCFWLPASMHRPRKNNCQDCPNRA